LSPQIENSYQRQNCHGLSPQNNHYHVSSSIVPGSSATFPLASAPPLHFGLGGTLSSLDTGYAGTAPSPSPTHDSVEATVAS